MKTWLGIAMMMMSCATRSGGAEESRPAPSAVLPVASAKPPTASAIGYQASYDEEAAGKNEAALDALEKLPSPQKDAYLAHLRRGWLLAKLGRSADAVAAYGRATAAEPASVEARLGALPPLATLRKWTEIETVARQVLDRDPGNYTAQIRLAFALYSLARYPDAEAAYRKLLALHPGDLEVRSGIGWALLKQGKTADAARVFSEITDVAPKHTLAQEGLRASTR